MIKGKYDIEESILLSLYILLIIRNIRNYHTKDYNFNIQNFWNTNFSNIEERYIGRLVVLLEPFLIKETIVDIEQLDSISKIIGVSIVFSGIYFL